MPHLLRIEKQYLKFSSAHFTFFPDGRERLHGHNYALTIELESQSLKDGFVVDFGPIKTVARQICDSLDERILLPTCDRLMCERQGEQFWVKADGHDQYCFVASEVLQLPLHNITGECLAEYVHALISAQRNDWDPERHVNHMRIWIEETAGQRAGFEADL